MSARLVLLLRAGMKASLPVGGSLCATLSRRRAVIAFDDCRLARHKAQRSAKSLLHPDAIRPDAPHMLGMENPNVGDSAELFVAGRRGSRSPSMNYQRFDRWEDAVRHAVEAVDLSKHPGTVIEVGDLRYDSHQISDMYTTLASPKPLRPQASAR